MVLSMRNIWWKCPLTSLRGSAVRPRIEEVVPGGMLGQAIGGLPSGRNTAAAVAAARDCASESGELI